MGGEVEEEAVDEGLKELDSYCLKVEDSGPLLKEWYVDVGFDLICAGLIVLVVLMVYGKLGAD